MPDDPPSSPPPQSNALVIASLAIDLAVVAALVVLGVAHVLPGEATAAMLGALITGRVVAKSQRQGGTGSGPGSSSVGGALAVVFAIGALFTRKHGV